MATFLFDELVFGPVLSRRLGLSLGINLLPVDKKVCNYDCVYCECGLSKAEPLKTELPGEAEVLKALEKKLADMKSLGEKPDAITFAGNGEPTLHPAFKPIMEKVSKLRDQYFPDAQTVVLTNATTIHKNTVHVALQLADKNMLKLDTAINTTFHKLNRPLNKNFHVRDIIDRLKKFPGTVIIQALFVQGKINGEIIDNTTPLEVEKWLQALDVIKPAEVMIYSIERDTPFEGLQKVPVEKLDDIANKVREHGYPCHVSK